MKTLIREQSDLMMRPLVIAYGHQCYEAAIVDCVAGTNQPKRVRILNDVRLQGKVLMPGDYTVKGYADED